jgi:hypothetical protein
MRRKCPLQAILSKIAHIDLCGYPQTIHRDFQMVFGAVSSVKHEPIKREQS